MMVEFFKVKNFAGGGGVGGSEDCRCQFVLKLLVQKD